MCAGVLSRQDLVGSPHCNSFSTRSSYKYVDVRSASSSHAEYEGIWAKAWKMCVLKSRAMRSRHSMGPSAAEGTWALMPGFFSVACGIRGSGPRTVDGGGQGSDDSH